ncbi:MAG TPA: MFS transporter [Caulobacteraceae bacterium]|nr:MFS transporter [Caulobacteraceae bacterium]
MKPQGRLSRLVVAAYSAPTFAEQIMLGPIFGILPALYAQHTRATLQVTGFIFMISRVLDSFLDPAVGYLSDITKSAFGPRKPWMLAGAITCVASVLLFYQPPSTAGGLYFFVWCTLLLVGWTTLVIPYNAWSVELTGDYEERSRLFAWRNTLGGIGGLVFALSPVITEPLTGHTEFTPKVMTLIAWALAVILPATTLMALLFVPRGESRAVEKPSLKALIPALRANRLIWLFVGITLVAGFGQGIATSLSFLYISSYLGLGAYISLFGAVSLCVTVGSIPIWLDIVRRFGKHLPWAIACFAQAFVAPILIFLPHGKASLIPMAVLSAAGGFLQGVMAVAPQSILADIIDYDTLKTGVNRAGNYFAFLTFLSKATTGLAGGLGLMIVGLFGFSPAHANTPTAVGGFLGTIAVAPAVLGFISGFLVRMYPIDERRQRVIQKRIAQRAERALRLASG